MSSSGPPALFGRSVSMAWFSSSSVKGPDSGGRGREASQSLVSAEVSNVRLQNSVRSHLGTG